MSIFDPDTDCTLVTDLKAYWKLDEASSTRFDVIGANDLTDNNTVTFTESGKVGRAAQLTNANSEYLSIADNADLSTGDIDFSICAWVYMDSKTDFRTIAVKRGNTTSKGEWLLDYNNTSDRFRFFVQDTSGTDNAVLADSLGSPSTGTWYFIVAWHDSVANTVNIQVNDGTVDSESTTIAPSDTAGDFGIGADQLDSPTRYWDGRIDEVGFWKKVLSAQERTDLYNSGSGNTHSALTTNLLAYWKLDEASGTRSDEWRSNDLTDNNTVTQATGKVGDAAQFTVANSEYLSIADNADLSLGDIDFTIAGWVYLDALGVNRDFASHRDTGDAAFRLYYSHSGTAFTFSVWNDSQVATSVADAISVSTDTWYFIVAWHDATANTINIQVNDGTAGSSAHTSGVHDADAEFQLGGVEQLGASMDGRLDEWSLWKRVLTTQERTDLYNSGSGTTLLNNTFSVEDSCTPVVTFNSDMFLLFH